MKLRVVFSAKAEMKEAMRYYNRRQPGLGGEFRDEIYRTFGRILDNPQAWPRIFRNTQRVVTRRFPYQVYFNVIADQVIVIAITHQCRDPEHWRDRLGHLE